MPSPVRLVHATDAMIETGFSYTPHLPRECAERTMLPSASISTTSPSPMWLYIDEEDRA